MKSLVLTPPMAPESELLYIAYGSNLEREQMKQRCPTARVLGASVLRGWRLVFYGCDDEGYHATIEPGFRSMPVVPVVIWGIQPSDKEALDAYEECANGLYHTEAFTIAGNFDVGNALPSRALAQMRENVLPDETAGGMQKNPFVIEHTPHGLANKGAMSGTAFAYVMSRADRGYGLPDKEYLETIRRGYMQAGFDERILDFALYDATFRVEDTLMRKCDCKDVAAFV